ncbi:MULTISPECIES: protease complex subunit PrcB family protein [Trichocoleus]|uniref:Protease complex subunit PrcB family protein n=1 Tax=Trichocoleus desertorum GB2-A4 TaxID=2933944 RepID=A0ABV0J6R9_9CYAN|nr:protease complex subunit PrcB family protein [Trichocoleus sp. FACHB-46]MBD1862442.1 protease complex subunit PrcB family protein [Trichocoleus sp. FACHB-46]
MQQIWFSQWLRFPPGQFWLPLLISGLAIALVSCNSLATALYPTAPTSPTKSTPIISTPIISVPTSSTIDASAKLTTMKTSIPFQVLRVGSNPLSQSMTTQPKVLVFQNQQDWSKFWNRSSSLDLNLQKPTAPSVDFSRHQVIGLTSGSHSTGGFSIQIDRIEKVVMPQREEWVIHYTEKVPGADCFVTQQTTTPTVFLLTATSDAPIRMQGKTISESCNS